MHAGQDAILPRSRAAPRLGGDVIDAQAIILTKTGAANRTEAARYAIRNEIAT